MRRLRISNNTGKQWNHRNKKSRIAKTKNMLKSKKRNTNYTTNGGPNMYTGAMPSQGIKDNLKVRLYRLCSSPCHEPLTEPEGENKPAMVEFPMEKSQPDKQMIILGLMSIINIVAQALQSPATAQPKDVNTGPVVVSQKEASLSTVTSTTASTRGLNSSTAYQYIFPVSLMHSPVLSVVESVSS